MCAANSSCGRDVHIDVNCVFEGRVVLGDGVRVGANCVLRDVEVAAGTRIEPFSLLEQAEIGAGLPHRPLRQNPSRYPLGG